MKKKNIILKKIKISDYQSVLNDMIDFTKKRKENTLDEIWLVEHYSVFTIGKSGKKKDIIVTGNIPVIKSNRGGQITYHGPGQQLVYVLLNLKKNQINIKKLIDILEKTIINTLLELNIISHNKKNYPGIYVKNKKICSIGLRVYKYYSLHGLALNVNMDLSPFKYINPCGMNNIKMTQIHEFIPGIKIKNIQPILVNNFFKLINLKK